MFSSRDNLNLNLQNNEEELIIYELVDSISLIQKKISNLFKSMEHNKKNDLYNKLSLIEDEIIKNKKKIKNYINEQKQNEINFKKMKSDNEFINKKFEDDLEEINERINNIISGGKNNDKEIYQISDDKINQILIEKKHEDELRDLKIDYNSIIIVYQKLLNILEININKKYQFNEKLNMLKEEKNVIKEKIIENISKKESFEEVAKIYLLKFINEIININSYYLEENINKENNNIIQNNNSENYYFEPSNGANSLLLNNKNSYLFSYFNISNENLKIYPYELNNININNLSNEIAAQLLFSINNCLKKINPKNNSLNNSMMIKKNKYVNENLHEKNINNNSTIESKIIYNSKENNSLTVILSSKIKKEILIFINSFTNHLDKNKENDFQKLINDFFINLSKETINLLNFYFNSQLKINKKEDNTSEKIINILFIFFKLIFKKFYLDNMIKNECEFLNYEYKTIKKNIKNYINLIIANINKLNNKKQEYDIKLKGIRQKNKLFQELYINDKVHTSLKDEAYFDLTKKSNQLIDNKNEVNDSLNSKQNDFQFKIENLNKKISNKKKNIKNLEKEKKIIEEKIAVKNRIIMNEIGKLKKIMEEKFKLIKAQIDSYKNKYGNNNNLYDKFIEKINQSLRITSKSLMNTNNLFLNKTYSNFYNNNNNSFYNNPQNNNTFYRINNEIKEN